MVERLSAQVIVSLGCRPQGWVTCPGCGQRHAWCEHLAVVVCGWCGEDYWPAAPN